MKNNKIGIVVSMIGIMVILYPIISNIVASYNQSIAISTYQEQMNKLSKEGVS